MRTEGLESGECRAHRRSYEHSGPGLLNQLSRITSPRRLREVPSLSFLVSGGQVQRPPRLQAVLGSYCRDPRRGVDLRYVRHSSRSCSSIVYAPSELLRRLGGFAVFPSRRGPSSCGRFRCQRRHVYIISSSVLCRSLCPRRHRRDSTGSPPRRTHVSSTTAYGRSPPRRTTVSSITACSHNAIRII